MFQILKRQINFDAVDVFFASWSGIIVSWTRRSAIGFGAGVTAHALAKTIGDDRPLWTICGTALGVVYATWLYEKDELNLSPPSEAEGFEEERAATRGATE